MVDQKMCGDEGPAQTLAALRHEVLRRRLKSEAARREASTAGPLLVRVDRSHDLPLSFPQERLWFLAQLDERASAAYHVHTGLRILGALNVPALRAALAAIVARHEVLRTHFEQVAGRVVQRIGPAKSGFSLRENDLTGEDLHGDALRGLVNEELCTRFDLSSGPLARGRLIRLSDQEHVLLVTMHHIVCDGWSTAVFFRELAALYEAHRQGRGDPLPPLPVQYADYAFWQRQWVSGERQRKQLQYWVEELRDTELLELPTDRARENVQTYSGDAVNVRLDERLIRGLKELNRTCGATLYMSLLAGWAVVLSRLSGQPEVVIGTPAASRNRVELEGLIGFFVDTLALRIGVSTLASARELLRHVKHVVLQGQAHRDIPFEQVVEAVRPVRSLAHNPLFQVMFSFDSGPLEPSSFSDLRLQTLKSPEGADERAHFDLSLVAREADGQVMASLTYATSLYERATIERYLEYWQRVLRAMVADADRAVGSLDLVGPEELEKVLYDWNATHSAYPDSRCLHELFEEQVRNTPEAVAVTSGSESLSYRELDEHANRLAHQLASLGVGPEVIVGLCVERSLEMVIGVLGVLKAGGAYLPLDPNHPPERLRYMLADAGARVLLRRRSFALESTEAVPVFLEIAQIQQQSPGRVASDVHPDNLAYVIYTSGSTGKPKGVMVPHRGAVNYLNWAARAYAQESLTGSVIVTPLVFDATVTSLFTPLICGRTVHLIPDDRDPMPQVVEHLTAKESRFLFKLTPAHLDLLRASEEAVRQATAGSTFIVGGEALLAHHVEPWRSGESIRIVNEYGPTETVVGCCVHEVGAATPRTGNVPIGRPIANARLYILDPRLRPLPRGAAGELYIGGVGVTRGYRNRPGLTAQAFVADPFGMPGGRLYRTGDRVRYRADNQLEYLGRMDHQIKIRGFRVELGEIEAALLQCPGVREAVVIAREDGTSTSYAGEARPAHKRLVAYITAQTEEASSSWSQSLRAQLSMRLPEYMVPAAYVRLDCLPLTVNGKVDRRALPLPDDTALSFQPYEAPEDDIEEALAAIWRDLLHVQRVGRSDSFFDLGGHSLLAIEATYRIKQFAGGLRLADIYQYPTIERLARRIRGEAIRAEHVNLSEETLLDAAITSNSEDCYPSATTNAVLLTGGTGFVGRFLLSQLLQDTDATLYCLVRAANRAHALERIRGTLLKWSLWRDDFAARIVAITGDIARPRLGLDDTTYEAVCRNVASIYHCAASVNFLQTYALVRAVNVESAREVLRIAVTGRPKTVHHISSLGVFAESADGDRLVNEDSSIEHEHHSPSQGYAASKWVAERIFMKAQERGIACNILRLGLICADSRQGRYDERQWNYRLVKTCLLSGYGIRHYRYLLPPTPVDYAARAIVHLAGSHPEGRGVFHISSPAEMLGEGMFENCNEIGRLALELLPRQDWPSQIRRIHAGGRVLPMLPLLERSSPENAVPADPPQSARNESQIRFDCTQTYRELAAAGIVMPAFDRQLLGVFLRSLLATDPDLREGQWRAPAEGRLGWRNDHDGCGINHSEETRRAASTGLHGHSAGPGPRLGGGGTAQHRKPAYPW